MRAPSFPKVLRFFPALAFLALVAATAFAHPSWGIVVSSTGIVYFSDLETVWKIDRDGTVSVFRAGVGGRHVHELSIDSNDNIYGPDSSYEPNTQKYLIGVWKITPDGKETQLQRPIDSLMSGISIWRDHAGNMYSIEQNNHTKTRTLLLRRAADGVVSTLAGSAYGQADGKGTSARLGSIYAMTIGPDENVYLTDIASVRRVSLDGTVTTLARNLATRTSEDKPTLFGGADKIIAGVAVDQRNNIYVADAGNRRLIKVGNDGKVSVVYRCDPPYFPTGVFATPSGDVYVLEFSFTPPGTTDSPRVRKISSDGQNILITSVGPPTRTGVVIAPPVQVIRSRFESFIRPVNARITYFVLLVAGVVGAAVIVWRIQRQRK